MARQVEEIRGDPALRVYAVILALVHVLTAFFWLVNKPTFAQAADHDGLAICWPFFTSCADYRFLGQGPLTGIVVGYGIVGAATAALWAFGRARIAWPVHVLLEVVKLVLIAQDFRLRLNQHYMAFFAAATFLLLPRKRDAVRVMLVLFYFWAGALKLDKEWLSGAALYAQPWLVPKSLTAEACIYVVVLEMLFSWGLLARRGAIFWAAFAQVMLFHFVSWGVVGFFYPVLMFLLLAIFPLARRDEGAARPSLFGRLLRGRLPGPAYALFGAFSLLQIVPRLYPGDSALTGEGRFLALHMFDAKIECRTGLLVHLTDGTSKPGHLVLEEAQRIHCDPLVIWNRARFACQELGRNPNFRDFDLVLDARHSTETQPHRLIDYKSFCANPPRYEWWHHNVWIRTDG